ncbi:MAG: MFS transporter [Chloroflexota bacterium]
MIEVNSPPPAAGSGPLSRLRGMPMWKALGVRDFRLVWIGESISVIGDQFYFVALPWLTLRLTGSAVALGTVLMASALPRAALILFGGALTDRASPRLLMLGSNALRAVLTGLLAALVLTGADRLWELYVLGALFGTVDALFYPAFDSIAPRLLEEERLGSGNALLQGSDQFSSLLGPAIAGVIIATFSGDGIGIAFGFDAISFAVAAVALVLVKGGGRLAPVIESEGSGTSGAKASLVREIVAGLSYAWKDPVLRVLLLVAAAASIAINSPLSVGLAVLARNRFSSGAAAFGVMFTVFGAGALIGTIVAGTMQTPRRRGATIIGLLLAFAAGLIAIALLPNLIVVSALLGLLGIGNGFVGVMLVTWMQLRTDPGMMGRVMSVLAFSQFGVAPVSLVVAGALAQYSVTFLFVAAGIVIGGVALAATSSRPLRTFD